MAEDGHCERVTILPQAVRNSSDSVSLHPARHGLLAGEEGAEDGRNGVGHVASANWLAQEDRGFRPSSLLSGRLGVFAAMAMAVAFFSVVLGFILSLVMTRAHSKSVCSAYGDGGAPPAAPSGALNGQPVVILMSMDGFRHGYHLKGETPNIRRVMREGTWAEDGMFPSFPSLTFPSHYSMATGLLPATHGIIANTFRDPANHSAVFTQGTTDPKWWLGEPIWETVTRQGLRAGTVFWPGADVSRPYWPCPSDYCNPYNFSMPFEERVDRVLAWLDLPPPLRPSLITLYVEEPDESGHAEGPDSPAVEAAVAAADGVVGRLMEGLDMRRITNDVNLILVSDHGMAPTCSSRVVSLEHFQPFITGLSPAWIDFNYPLVGLFVPEPPARTSSAAAPALTDAASVVATMKAAVDSGAVVNGHALKIYLKEDFPARFNFSGSSRIPPILALVDEGYSVVYHHSSAKKMRRRTRLRQPSGFHAIRVYGERAKVCRAPTSDGV